MKKIAIILEDMRIGGPQKQLIYFLQESIKKKNKSQIFNHSSKEF